MRVCARYIIGSILVLIPWISRGQNGACNDDTKLCPSGHTFNLTSGVTVPLLGGYGCIPLLNILTTYVRFQVAAPGDLVMKINNPSNPSISYIVWGPYASDSQIDALLGGACGLLGLLGGSGSVVACGGSNATNQSFIIPGVAQGQIYVLMISKQVQVLFPPAYNVTVSQDASSTASIGPVFTTTQNNLTCNGSNNGSITVSATGNSPLTYSLDGGPFLSGNVFTGLGAGNHTVAVKDVNCTITGTVTLTQPPILTQSITPVNASTCPPNGSIMILGGGGSPPYEYSINNGSSYQAGSNPYTFGSLAAATYGVRVKDNNGCMTAASGISLTGPAIPTLAVNSFYHPTCTNGSNGSVTFSATSGLAPFQYSIDNGASYAPGSNPYAMSGLSPGSYLLKVKAASGCESSATLQTLTGQHPPPLGILTGSTICQGQQATLMFTVSAGMGPYTLTINGNSLSGILSGVPFNVAPNPAVTTDYLLTEIIDNNGCISD